MSASESDSISQMEVYMGEEKRDRDAEFSFMKEKVKEQPLYRTLVQKDCDGSDVWVSLCAGCGSSLGFCVALGAVQNREAGSKAI